MRVLSVLALGLTLGSCAAQQQQLFEVTGAIVESEDMVECWSASTFVRTDIRVTNDSIYFIKALGEYNKMIVTEAIDWCSVIEFEPGNNELAEPGRLTLVNDDTSETTTYLLFDLENHYE
jgi:hypothetical protein